MKTIRYALEAALLYLLFAVFGLLPAQTASAIGGWLGRVIGPRLAASRKAFRNLERALPLLHEEDQAQIIAGMWSNLGRIMAEYPHLAELAERNTVIENTEILDEALEQGGSIVFFSGHLGNWEINAMALYLQYGEPAELTYRAPNNPWSDRLLLRARTLDGALNAHPKERKSAKSLFKAMQEGRHIATLIDQKYNEGMYIPFFGEDAATNPAFVQLSQKLGSPMIPVQCIRTEGANFILRVHEPLRLFEEGGKARPVEDVLRDTHKLLEGWIRDNPAQWLWLHRRWKS